MKPTLKPIPSPIPKPIPSTHPFLRPFLRPSLNPFLNTLKIPPSKAFKYYYVLITIFKKENLVVSKYKTIGNINSNFIRIKNKYHYFNWNVRVISKRYMCEVCAVRCGRCAAGWL